MNAPAPGKGSAASIADTTFTLPALPRIRAQVDRIERITVCTRPFRGAGPRLEAERLGRKLLIHNYGHGGAGWSLGWGSGANVAKIALANEARAAAVIGCGAIGLTTALTLQRAGFTVTVYARDLPPDVRSSRATGLWSPDSRVALARETDRAFAERWEAMARTSWAMFAELRGLPDSPVALHNRYLLSDLPPDEEIALRYSEDPIGFAHLDERLADLYGPARDFGPGEHAFRTRYCRTVPMLRFSITELSRTLLAEFLERNGNLRSAEFFHPDELAKLPEPTLVNCTGWGARTLFADPSLLPVRGQIGWLPAQPEVDHSLQWGKLSMVSRADGVAVQLGASSDGTGWGDADEIPDPLESEQAVGMLAAIQGERG